MLQLDELSLHHIRLKISVPKVMNGIIFQEGIKRMRTKRLALAGKGKKVVEEKAEVSQEEEDSPEQSPVKRRRRTDAEIIRTLIFDEPELEPEASPVHSCTHSLAHTTSLASTPPKVYCLSPSNS